MIIGVGMDQKVDKQKKDILNNKISIPEGPDVSFTQCSSVYLKV
jgi:hypothetical protein